MKKRIFIILFCLLPFFTFAQYSDLYNFGYELGLRAQLTYTEVEDTISISANRYAAYKFKLDASSSEVTVEMKSDNDLNYYLLDAENYALFKNGKRFYYYGEGFSVEGTNEIYGCANFGPGIYYYVVYNTSKKACNVQRLITVYPHIL